MALTNEQLTKWIDEIFGTIDEIKTNSGDITELTADVSTLKTNVTNLQTAVASLDGSVDNIEDIIAANNAASHNAQYRGVDLGLRDWSEVNEDGYITENGLNEIYTRISSGTFEDIYIGDYFKIKMVSDFGTEDVICVMADFDTYLHTGNVELTDHHAVIVPQNCLASASAMNSTNTTGVSQNPDNPVGSTAATADQLGGYAGSDMHQIVIPKYNAALSTVFGSHLITYKTILDDGMDATKVSSGYSGFTGASPKFGYYDSTAELLNEVQVFGANVFSSSGFNTGIHCTQLSLFRFNPSAIRKKRSGSIYPWWLRSVTSSQYYANVNAHGYASFGGASGAFGVVPFWLIGKAPVTNTTQTRKTKKTLTKKED